MSSDERVVDALARVENAYIKRIKLGQHRAILIGAVGRDGQHDIFNFEHSFLLRDISRRQCWSAEEAVLAVRFHPVGLHALTPNTPGGHF